MLPPIVRFPAYAKDSTASLELSTTTKSVISAPTANPHPIPPVAIQEGADQVPSSRRAMTTPDPALPVTINPALTILNTAKPLALWSTAFGMLFSADDGSSGLAKNDFKMSALLSHSRGKLKSSSGRLAISPANVVAELAPVLARFRP